ncbi:MAG: PorV/PorQ family protein [Elusimicrobiota bacterium]|jgi:hypothetical protein
MKRALLAVLLVSALGGTQRLWAGAGAEPLDFLFLDADARAVAMGGAYTALAANANALLYNPAGLARVRVHEATFMHSQSYQDIRQEYAAFAAKQGWGVNVNHLSFGDVPRTTISNPEGSGLSSTGLSDLALGAGYGLRVGDALALGLGGKFIRESIAGVSAQGYALDLGALYDPSLIEGLTFGAALQNVGPAIRFQKARENLPLNMRAGAAYGVLVRDRRCSIALDFSKERSESTAFMSVGLEVFPAERMPLRLGYSSRNDAGPGITAGIGYQLADFSVDYAFVPYGALGNAHRISATVRWGGSVSARREPVLKPAALPKRIIPVSPATPVPPKRAKASASPAQDAEISE